MLEEQLEQQQQQLLHGQERDGSRDDRDDDQETMNCPHTLMHQFNRTYMPVMITLGFVGNCLTVAVFMTKKLRRLASNHYLAAMAVADTGVLVCQLMTLLGRKYRLALMPSSCQLLIYANNVFSCLSVWFVVGFTIERFVAVWYPLARLRYCTVRMARTVIFVTSAAAIVLYTYSLVFVTATPIYAEASSNDDSPSHHDVPSYQDPPSYGVNQASNSDSSSAEDPLLWIQRITVAAVTASRETVVEPSSSSSSSSSSSFMPRPWSLMRSSLPVTSSPSVASVSVTNFYDDDLDHGGGTGNENESACDVASKYKQPALVMNYVDTMLTLVVPLILIGSLNASIACKLLSGGYQTSPRSRPIVRRSTNRRRVQSCPRADLDRIETSSSIVSDHSHHDHHHQTSVRCSFDGCATIRRHGGRCIDERMTRLLLIISAVFLVMNVPDHVVRMIVFALDESNGWGRLSADEQCHFKLTQQITNTAFNTYFAINFILYNLVGVSFRRELKRQIRRVCLSFYQTFAPRCMRFAKKHSGSHPI